MDKVTVPSIKGVLIFLREDKGLDFRRIQSLVHMHKSQATPLPLRK